jgi:hypothetical protein
VRDVHPPPCGEGRAGGAGWGYSSANRWRVDGHTLKLHAERLDTAPGIRILTVLFDPETARGRTHPWHRASRRQIAAYRRCVDPSGLAGQHHLP